MGDYRFHEYLKEENFEVFIDNDPFTCLLTTVKLNDTGQRWVENLANYNFRLHYRSGKLNVEVDALQRIPWEWEEASHTLDAVVVLPIISRGYNGGKSIPETSPYTISAVTESLMVNSTAKLSKQDWKMEQQADIGHRNNNNLNQ